MAPAEPPPPPPNTSPPVRFAANTHDQGHGIFQREQARLVCPNCDAKASIAVTDNDMAAKLMSYSLFGRKGLWRLDNYGATFDRSCVRKPTIMTARWFHTSSEYGLVDNVYDCQYEGHRFESICCHDLRGMFQ